MTRKTKAEIAAEPAFEQMRHRISVECYAMARKYGWSTLADVLEAARLAALTMAGMLEHGLSEPKIPPVAENN